MEPTRVLLVDDQKVVVQGVHAILDREAGIEVVGEATSAEEALTLLGSASPDVVVMDVSLHGASGIQLARVMKARSPSVRILALATYTDDECVVGMIQAGADGFIPKSVTGAELALSIRQVSQGQVVYPAAAKRLFSQGLTPLQKLPAPATLTDREREILRLIAMGATSREIARELYLSSKTVDNHRARILEKLQVRNKAEAVARAIRGGFIEPELLDPKARPSERAVPPSPSAAGKKPQPDRRPPGASRPPEYHAAIPRPPAARALQRPLPQRSGVV